MNDRRVCAVVGGGPAGLIAAEYLALAGCAVTVYDQMPSLARKFLMAGIGGLNLTHSEPFERFVERYRPESEWLRGMLAAFPPDALRAWCEELGEPCYTGTSGRVFPKSFKASPLLRAWLRRLASLGVAIRPRHRWTGWRGNALIFETPAGEVETFAETTVLAVGGASWPKLGSDGRWVDLLDDDDITINPLSPSNCAVRTNWSARFRERFGGEPLKSIAMTCGGETSKSEAVVTEFGLEGGAVYSLSQPLRGQFAAQGYGQLYIDLKPELGVSELAEKIAAARKGDSLSNKLRKAAKLSPIKIALCREPEGTFSTDPTLLAEWTKGIPIRVDGFASNERAISTAGGVSWSSVDKNLMLRNRAGVFVCGEMLDWDAPTGGYLLQASFATGVAAAKGALTWLESKGR